MASAFPPTRHSVIERLRQTDAGERSAAFGDLVEGYWKPVCKHLRATWRLSAEDAQDLTQAFFLDALQKAWLEKYEPGKARFRTFVRVCVDRFAMNARQACWPACCSVSRSARPFAFLIAAMPTPDGKHYYWEIILPGSVLGLIVGYATQKYGGADATRQP